MILLGDPLIDGPSKMVHLRVDLTKVRLAQVILLGDPLIDGPSKMVHLRVDLTKVRLAQGSP